MSAGAVVVESGRGRRLMSAPVVPWAGRLLALVALGSIAVSALLAGRYGDWVNFGWWAPTALAFSVVGWILAARVPGNAVSWLTLAFGLLMAVELLSLIVSEHADLADQVSRFAEWAAWVRLVGIDLLVVLLIPLLLVFPDGRLPSRQWRAVLWLIALVGSMSTLLAGTTTTNWHNPAAGNPNYYNLRPPFTPVPLAHAQSWYDLTSILLMALVLVAVAGLASRYRNSSAQQRAQITWVLAAAVVIGIAMAASSIVFQNPNGSALTLPLLPLAIGVAVLRFRLYDIDRLISRSISYAIVTGFVLLTYAVIIGLATRLVPNSSNLAVAAATLAAAAIARPVLSRVRGWVDRRFNRPRFDAVATVERFGSELRDEVELDRVERELLTAVRDTLQPDRTALWVVSRS